MGTYDLEEDDDLENPVDEGSMEGGLPNVYRDPDKERRDKMKSYLMEQGIGPPRQRDPALDRAPVNELRGSSRDLALMNLLNQSANQIGNIGGKATSSAPADQYFQSLQRGNEAAIGDIMRERQSAEADEQRREKMKQALTRRMMGTDQQAAALAERQKTREATGEYRNKMLDLKSKEIQAKAEKQPKEKEATEGERKFGAFADRAQSANDAYEAYVKEKPNAASLSTKDFLIGKYGGELGAGLMSDEAKMTKQLEKEFIGSVLRPETGAAASDDEWAMYGAKYFPRAGDTPEQLARKALIRKQDIGTMRTIAGKGASAQPPSAMAAAPATTTPQAQGGGTGTPPVTGAIGAQKTEMKRQYSPSRNKTRIIYSDGSEEIIDGKG